MERWVQYFELWKDWSKDQSKNTDEWNVKKWDQLFIPGLTLKNLKICLSGFLYYAKEVLSTLTARPKRREIQWKDWVDERQLSQNTSDLKDHKISLFPSSMVLPSGRPEDDMMSKLLKYIGKEEEHNTSSYSDMLLENEAFKEFAKLSTNMSPLENGLKISFLVRL